MVSRLSVSIFTNYIIVFLLFSVESCWSDESALQQFYIEAPKGWQKIISYYDGKEFKFEVDILETGRTIEGRVETFQKQIRIEIDVDTSNKMIHFSNSDYLAEVEGKNSRNQLISLKPQSNKNSSSEWAFAYPGLIFLDYRHLPTSLILDEAEELNEEILVPMMFGAKEAKFQYDEYGRAVVTVKLKPMIDSKLLESIEGQVRMKGWKCEISLWPERNWCLTKVLLENPINNSAVYQDYIYSEQGFHPKEMTLYNGPLKFDYTHKRILRFKEPTKRMFSNENFRITSLGFPEPPEFAKVHISRQPWFIASAVLIVLFIAHFFYRLSFK